MTRPLDRASAEQAFMSLFTSEGFDDPYPAYARLREMDPVHHSETLGMWVLSRFEDCRRVLVDDQGFGVLDRDWLDVTRPVLRASYASRRVFALLPFRNPPEHTRLRRLLMRDFTARRVEARLRAVRNAVATVLDNLEEQGAGESVVDFQEIVSFPLTLTVAGGLLGVPVADLPTFPRLTDGISLLMDPAADPAAIETADAAALEFFGYLERLIARRRAAPRDDLISALVAVHEDDPERLSETELAEAVFLLFAAGFETTATVLGNGLQGMVTDRDRFVMLARKPSLASSAAAEVLRWGPSIHMQKRRTMRDTEIDGSPVPAGAIVIPLLAAANRDPARFFEPDRFDITRNDGAALTFGGGIHMCLGAALARLEISVLAVELARRFPNIEVAGPQVVRQSANIRRVQHLPVRIG